jgi:hypothetical protein
MTNEQALRVAEEAMHAQTTKCNALFQEVAELRARLDEARKAELALADDEEATPKQYAAAAKLIRDTEDALRQAGQRQKVQQDKRSALVQAASEAQKRVNADAQSVRAKAANAAASRVDDAYEALNKALEGWRQLYGEAAAYGGAHDTMRDMQRILWLVSAARLRAVELPSCRLPTGYEFDGYFDAVKHNPSLPLLAETIYV